MSENQTPKSVDDVKAALVALPPKAGTPAGARTIVTAAVEQIREAMEKGYTYDEIAALLTENGYTIKAGTLRQYIGQASTPKKKPAPKRAKKPKAETASATPAAAPAATETQKPEAQKQGRIRRDL